MRWRGVGSRRVRRREFARSWIARAHDPRTSGLVRDELDAILEHRRTTVPRDRSEL